MKKKVNITIVVISVLFTIMLAFGSSNTVYAVTTYKKDVTIIETDFNYDYDYYVQDLLADKEHKAEDILIVSKQFKELTIDVDFIANCVDAEKPGGIGEISDDITVTLSGKYDTVESIKKDVEAAILKEKKDIISIEKLVGLFVNKAICEVEYKYRGELVIGEELNLPCTKADGKYELSPLTIYISRSRVSYVIEDGGEFFIPEDDYNFFIWHSNQSRINDAGFLDIVSYAYYNVDWKCFKKAGTIVGELNKVENKHNPTVLVLKDRYTIGHQTYYKLSDIIEDWSADNRKLFEYDNKTKTLYYGKKPTAKDKLQKDEIYEFVKNVTKGCKTDKEKLKAIHDAIVKKYSVHEDVFHMRSFPEYVMRDNLFDAKKLMKDKAYSSDGFADLFKECCNRLLIPCNLVDDGYLYWNRVYLDGKTYHVDTATDATITQATKDKTPYRKFFLKSSYEFMGTHIWEGEDYTPEKFSKKWKDINRNNIKTTDELRRAASYASYLSKDGKKRTYTFKIKGNNVNTYCEGYVYNYGYISNITSSYKKGILTLTFN